MNDVNFQNFGYPELGDNVRGKSKTYHDTATIATGQTEYNLFSSAPSGLVRNKQFPFANDEIFFVKTIRGSFSTLLNYTTFQYFSQLLTRSYLAITVNDKEYLKIPGHLWVDYFFSQTIGNNAQNIGARQAGVSFKLPIPIVINANANVQLKLVVAAQVATTFNASTLWVQLGGVKFDKLSAFNYDSQKNKTLEKISYVCYDSFAASAAAGTQTLFTNSGKAQTDYSKYFPLSSAEAFEIGAIQIASFGYEDVRPEIHFSARVTQRLKLLVNGVDLLDLQDVRMHYILGVLSGTFTDATPTNTNFSNLGLYKSIYVLPEPVIIPTSAQVTATLEQGVLNGTASQYSCVSLIGALTRKVQ